MAKRQIYPPIHSGKRFGRLTVVAEAPPNVSPKGNKARRWRCRCDCGAIRDVQQGALNLGITVSCGCHRRETFSRFRELQTPKRFDELLGGKDRFGRWTVIAEDESGKGFHRRRALCRCDCGVERTVDVQSLLAGGTRSCGCLKLEGIVERSVTHGQAGHSNRTPEYRAWADAKSRCYNPNVRNYAEYGGRGIRMCDRWRGSFEAFFEDVGPRPSPKHSLDRWPNQDGNYEPGNVRWATGKQQGRNTRTNRRINYEGQTMTLVEASERFGIKRATIAVRLDAGWSVHDALTTPIRRSRRWHQEEAS